MSSPKCLFLSEELSDVCIKVRGLDGRSWRFPGHSLILRTNSDWFNETIHEQSLVSPHDITITFVDIAPQTIFRLLKFVYSGQMPTLLPCTDLLDLLEASIRLRIWQLEAECETKLLRTIRVSNACKLLERASGMLNSGHGSRILVEACQRLILDYAQIVFASDLVLHLHRHNLQYLLKSDSLNVLEEDVVFSGLWKWGRKVCCMQAKALTQQNIMDTLHSLIENVRFPLLINPTVIPEVVVERFCKCPTKKSKSCCCLIEEPKVKCRKEYKPPRDLLYQSYQLSLLDSLKTWHSMIPLVDRLLCTQISVEEDVFAVAVAIAVLLPRPNNETLQLSIILEDTSVEIHREEVIWEETCEVQECDGKDRSLATILKLCRPVLVKRHKLHSMHLLLPKCQTWRFPARQVHTRKNNVLTEEGTVLFNVHSDRIIALTSIYFIPAEAIFI